MMPTMMMVVAVSKTVFGISPFNHFEMLKQHLILEYHIMNVVSSSSSKSLALRLLRCEEYLAIFLVAWNR